IGRTPWARRKARAGCFAARHGEDGTRTIAGGCHVDYRDRHVVVTGGAGALGTAVVGALTAAGATCHVPCLNDTEAQRFALRDHPNVRITVGADLASEGAVAGLYDGVPQLWASIHLAGGFAATAISDTGKADLMRQIDLNLVTCFLCCRA